MASVDDDNSWSIHDLDHAPEPPMDGGSGMLSGVPASPRERYTSDGHNSWRRNGGVNQNRERTWSGQPHPQANLSYSDYYSDSPSKRSLTNAAWEEDGGGGSERLNLNSSKNWKSNDKMFLSLPALDTDPSTLIIQNQEESIEFSYEENTNRNRANSSGSDRHKLDQLEEPSEEEEEEEEGEAGDSLSDTDSAFFLGFKLPIWCTWRLSLHRMATFVVTKAPCFCCLDSRQPTDRSILARLNVLVGFFAAFQLGSFLFLTVVIFSPSLVDRSIETETLEEKRSKDNRFGEAINVWQINTSVYLLGIIAFIVLVSSILTVKVVRNVNLVGAIRYLWVLLWIIPFEIYFNIGLYDYFRVTHVWVRHYWRAPSLSWFRMSFCNPSSTANTLCTVPRGINETDWCLENYNSTACTAIRDSAQDETRRWFYAYYYANAWWGLVLICLLFLVVDTLEGIISKPLVQKSRESNVPAWMSLPVIGCVVFGLVFSFSQSSIINQDSSTDFFWLGPLYLGAAGLFLLAAVLGWYISQSEIMNTAHKRNKMISIAAFVFLMFIILGLLSTLFAASIAFSISFVNTPLTDAERGEIACFIDAVGSCTNCEAEIEEDRCLEWTASDVTSVIRTQAKASAALAAIFMLYAFSALRFGLGMRKHIRMYQIEYV